MSHVVTQKTPEGFRMMSSGSLHTLLQLALQLQSRRNRSASGLLAVSKVTALRQQARAYREGAAARSAGASQPAIQVRDVWAGPDGLKALLRVFALVAL
jgi:hypothetical protein